ncbi:MAG: hypothetical protein ACTTI6_05100, partial [Treponema sp.]
MIQKVENLASLKHFFERYPDYAESENAEDAARISAAWNILLKERMPQVQNGSAENVPTVPASDHAPTDQQAAPITSDDGIPHDIAHSLRMAHSLAALEMDSESIVCALLY